jgi:hypothetical protein
LTRRQVKPPELRRAKGWTAYERYGRDPIIRADGEIVLSGSGEARPATKAEIEAEQAKRRERDERLRLIEAFGARPEWKDAESIRSVIEVMEYDNHPLDRLTADEWRALRFKICGPREGEEDNEV